MSRLVVKLGLYPIGAMAPAQEILDAIRAFPIVMPQKAFGDRGILILAPHPDDESLGCGGLISDCSARGQDVHIMIVTDGARSHPHSRQYPGSRLARLREQEARDAVKELGISLDRLTFLGLSDGSAPKFGPRFHRVVSQIARYARNHEVGTICTTWNHDPHRDHVATYWLGRAAAQRTGAKLFCYPVWGWTLPEATLLPTRRIQGIRIDISEYLPAKLRAIASHRSQASDLIKDDPQGFRLSPDFLAIFSQPYEAFIDA